MRPSLNSEQMLSCATAHLVHGVEIAILAEIFHTNQGRISEAVTALRYATENPREIYALAVGKKVSTDPPVQLSVIH